MSATIEISATTAPATPAPATRERLHFIDGFRGFSIIMVVAGHVCFALVNVTGDAFWPSFIENIATGDTALFVFISGVLFHHVFLQKWDFAKFMTGKVKGVYVPYLWVTAFLVALQMTSGSFPYEISHFEWPRVYDFYTVYAFSLVSGQAGVALWYVPFITIIFLMSPLFKCYSDASAQTRIVVLTAALLIGLTVNRPIGNIDKFQAIAYNTFYYLMGIEFSLRRSEILAGLRKAWTLPGLAVLLILLALMETMVQGHKGDFGTWFAWHGFNWRYLEKVAFIFLGCAVFTQFPRLNGGPMKRLAEDSFGIFFVHNLVLLQLQVIVGEGAAITGVYVLDMLIYTAGVLAFSWLLVWMLKRVTKEHSRMVIGA